MTCVRGGPRTPSHEHKLSARNTPIVSDTFTRLANPESLEASKPLQCLERQEVPQEEEAAVEAGAPEPEAMGSRA